MGGLVWVMVFVGVVMCVYAIVRIGEYYFDRAEYANKNSKAFKSGKVPK